MDRSDSAYRSPVILFLELWRVVSDLSSFQRLTAVVDPDFCEIVDSALMEDDGALVYDALHDIIELTLRGALRNVKNGALVMTMQRIDNIFLNIHPRLQFSPPLGGQVSHIPNWLQEASGLRLSVGHYLEVDSFRLIPKGPLVRLPREEFAANAENMVDMFAALSVVPRYLIRGKRPIKLEHIVVTSASFGGVTPGSNPGGETVAFIPVAEGSTDLVITSRSVGQQDFADFRLAPHLNASDIMFESIRLSGPVDIAVAPELVVSATHSAMFSTELVRNPLLNVRLILAGTGQTDIVSEDGNAWNEARILNGRGHEIWRQRKVWPAGLNSSRAKQYSIPHFGKSVMEDNAEGDTVVVSDVEGLGRCVVLICQDVEAKPLADDLVREFQPDWVFVPILDPGIQAGRWVHQRVFELSSNSNARYLVVSSTALAHPSASPTVCGIAVGPKSASCDGSDAGRLLAEAAVSPHSKVRCASITWRSGVWSQTQMGSMIASAGRSPGAKPKRKSYKSYSKKRR